MLMVVFQGHHFQLSPFILFLYTEYLIDLHGFGATDTFFFTKPHIWQSSEDIKALHRLGPSVNMTTHDTQTDAGMTMVIRDNSSAQVYYSIIEMFPGGLIRKFDEIPQL